MIPLSIPVISSIAYLEIGQLWILFVLTEEILFSFKWTCNSIEAKKASKKSCAVLQGFLSVSEQHDHIPQSQKLYTQRIPKRGGEELKQINSHPINLWQQKQVMFFFSKFGNTKRYVLQSYSSNMHTNKHPKFTNNPP